MLYLHPEASGPIDPQTKAPVFGAAQRVEACINEALKARHRLVIPTPALAECLTQHDTQAGAAIVAKLEKKAGIEVKNFCALSALEVGRYGKKNGYMALDSTAPKKYQRALVKHDLQILAIAQVVNANQVLTDDRTLKQWAKDAGMAALGVADLPLPSKYAQIDIQSSLHQ